MLTIIKWQVFAAATPIKFSPKTIVLGTSLYNNTLLLNLKPSRIKLD